MNKELERFFYRMYADLVITTDEAKATKHKYLTVNEIFETAPKIKQALTPPTQEEVCKALSRYYNLPVKFHLQHNCFVIVKGYDHIIVVEQEVKKNNVRFNSKKALPALPPNLVTMIGRFYEGVIVNDNGR